MLLRAVAILQFVARAFLALVPFCIAMAYVFHIWTASMVAIDGMAAQYAKERAILGRILNAR